ncbi:MAG: hypothetical protein QME96_10515 [Myxococcota bacterium]|nr:hypothetical protein [Myxococcota bacterium]
MTCRLPAIAVACAAFGGCGDDGGHVPEDARPEGDTSADSAAPEDTAPACRDGIDNDWDGATDCADEGCLEFVFCADAHAADGDADTDDADADDDVEAGVDSDGDDAGPALCPPDDGCGPTELCGDGLDNDCDGEVDDADAGCTCRYGDVQVCFTGPPGRRGLGGCLDGRQVCNREGAWGPCRGGVRPVDEIPDHKDNDCDGCVDNGVSGAPSIRCPVAFDSVNPRWFVLRCADICEGGDAGGCDCTWSVAGPEGAGLTVGDRLAETTRLYLDASGHYLVTATVLDRDLYTWRCTFVVRALPSGLGVDLWWEDPDPFSPGNLDLHLHRDPPRTGWYDQDDCHWGNCGGRDGTYTLDWAYPDTPLDRCQDLPENHEWDFVARGSCPNPRLVHESFQGAAPEVTVLDLPRPGDRFRVMAQYYMDGAPFWVQPAHAYVRITCGGRIRAEYGPVTMTSRDYGTGDLWRAADIAFTAPGECTVTPIGGPGSPDVRDFDSRGRF